MNTRAVSLALFSLAVACTTPGGGSRQDRPPADPWTPLFDGVSLGAWRVTEFGGEGEVFIDDGRIVLDFGSPLSGITWSGDFPRVDYQLELDAARLAGSDFFCGLTFPVSAGHCTLILGGWGGALCGLSCIDGKDASENDTTSYRNFELERVYRVRVQVTGTEIVAWVDDEEVARARHAGHVIALRPEVARSAPLGLAAFSTRAAYRNLRYREQRDR